MANDVPQLKLGRPGGDRRSAKAKIDQACKKDAVASLKYGTADHWLARLDRDYPGLAARVRAKELSANAAAVEVGFRKPPLRNWARRQRIDPCALIG